MAFGLWTVHFATAQTPPVRPTAIDLSVMVNSNGTLVAPTNFFSVNAALVTDPSALHSASNFADINNAAIARANLGLASAATNSASAFQPANANLTNWSTLATNQAALTNDARPVSHTNTANSFAGSFNGSFSGSSAALTRVTAQSATVTNAGAGYVAAIDAAHNLTNSSVLSANLPDLTANNNFTGTNTFATNNAIRGNFGSLAVTNGLPGKAVLNFSGNISGTITYAGFAGMSSGQSADFTNSPDHSADGVTGVKEVWGLWNRSTGTPISSGTNITDYVYTNGAYWTNFSLFTGDGSSKYFAFSNAWNLALPAPYTNTIYHLLSNNSGTAVNSSMLTFVYHLTNSTTSW